MRSVNSLKHIPDCRLTKSELEARQKHTRRKSVCAEVVGTAAVNSGFVGLACKVLLQLSA